MELRIYFRMLVKGWWIIALIALVTMNAALVSAYLQPPTYRASATFVVSPNPAILDTVDAISSLETLDKRSVVTTYVEFLKSSRIYQETLNQLKLNPSAVAKYTYTAVVIPDTNILELSVEGPDPQMAALLANNIGATAIASIHKMYQFYDISQLDPSLPPAIPISPQPLRDAGIALFLGLAVGTTLVILREQLLTPLEFYRQRRMIDPVSLAYTRRSFQTTVENELARNTDANLSLGLVKLNGLEDMIEVLPQSMVQKLLTGVNKLLHKELRGNDIVGRWDDITFAIMLPSTSEAAALRTMERIAQALAKPITMDQNSEAVDLQPTFSVSANQARETARELVERVEVKIGKIDYASAPSSD